MAFVAHGMGLVPHEAPRLTGSGPIRYEPTHRDRQLEAGMVLSIETDLRVPGIGLLKLEDTVVVRDDGWEAYGDTRTRIHRRGGLNEPLPPGRVSSGAEGSDSSDRSAFARPGPALDLLRGVL